MLYNSNNNNNNIYCKNIIKIRKAKIYIETL